MYGFRLYPKMGKQSLKKPNTILYDQNTITTAYDAAINEDVAPAWTINTGYNSDVDPPIINPTLK